ncbi:MAG TPA: phosphate ABC transporter permease PstA [Caldisericia bacterium]|nr:phosphate ABC transporter permease PstA [Caldisericia bacterium]OQB73181.1 MAG: Phosphate transport system permease protein PstA [bacterium ADurb.Bin132]HNY61655.1 phosphate ABC transporter permease PstA [Caldisericia bacterium]HOC79506.1 phosphate ABC transporter permease PstA [Caldisericia bacterium]HOG70656.1 phosphate ABC transporter permease PstA [Caldisericia bacterium]
MAKKKTEKIVYGVIWFVTYLVVFMVGYIIFDIVIKGLPAISWGFLTQMPAKSGSQGGILPAIVGTFYLVIGTVAIALPLGIASAIYLNEYSKPSTFTRMIRLGISTLAGVPSIVFGLFGMGLFVLALGFGKSILAGSLTLACMVLPTIIVASEEALKAVPDSMREGSLALGATKWQTIYKNVLPYALPGMLTGSILGIGRAAGETAPIIFTVAATLLPRLPRSIFDQVMALPYHLYMLATQMPNQTTIKPMQYGTAFVLLVIVLGVDVVAIIFRSRLRRKNKW